MMPTVAARVLVVVLALAGVAWLAVEARSSAAQDEIIGLAFTRDAPSKADLARARELAPRARRLNPDVRVDESLGVLELRTGDRAGAVATFKAIAAREPRNAEVWAALAQAARGYDDRLATEARSRSRELAPPVRSLR
jgi:Flp pilus assembly protein TadD